MNTKAKKAILDGFKILSDARQKQLKTGKAD